MQWTVSTALAALCWWTLLLVLQAQQDFIVGPENVTVGLGLGLINLTCQAQRDNVFVEIDGKIAGLDVNNTVLSSRGIIVNPQSHNGTVSTMEFSVDSIERNNGTTISCFGVDDNDVNNSRAIISPEAHITIIGPPLPPSLQYSPIDELRIALFWEEPYTASGFPITSYFLRVENTYQSSPILLNYTELSPEIHAVNLTRVDTTSCTNLTVKLWAQNEFRNSSSSTVNTGFLTGPQSFEELPMISVTFSSEGSPILQLDFVLPLICPFNNATYKIEIKDAANMVVHTEGPFPASGSLISMVLTDIGLEADAHYILNISIQNTVGHTVSVTMFNTSTSASLSESFDPTVTMAASIGGAVGVILLLIVLIMCIIYITRRTRRRRREIFHITEYSNGTVHSNGHNRGALDIRGMQMVDNSIYEKDPIYEEIFVDFFNPEEGYMSLSSPAAANTPDQQEKLNDDYTRMASAGTLQGQFCVSNAAVVPNPDKEAGCDGDEAPDKGIGCAEDEGAGATECSEQQDKEDRYTVS